MKRSLALLCLLSATAIAIAAPRPEQQHLIGKWVHKRLEQRSNGKVVSSVEAHGDSSLEFKKDGTWQMTSPSATNGGTYFWMNRQEIDTTTKTSSLAAQIGWHSVKQIKIDGKTLTMTTKYDNVAVGEKSQGASSTPPMNVISVFEREAATKP
jgi:hypothetical protein